MSGESEGLGIALGGIPVRRAARQAVVVSIGVAVVIRVAAARHPRCQEIDLQRKRGFVVSLGPVAMYGKDELVALRKHDLPERGDCADAGIGAGHLGPGVHLGQG